ncbi:MAG TPA: MSMEG_0565 family glycosyltransferase [Xanthobacteraceae bacterium]|jgi:glycosyltransferase-like protein
MRIGILAHSTNPRGGVVHALELGDALTRLGHEATVLAPDPAGAGFFRNTLCETLCVRASPVGSNLRDMVEARVANYLRHFERSEARCFEVWHAQDGISGNALATLKDRGLISAYGLTVHHVEHFDDDHVNALRARAIKAADRLFVVSDTWRDWLEREHARDAHLVGNGVDTRRFSPVPDATDSEFRVRFNLPAGAAVFLTVGGVEERKNTIRIVQAFQKVRLQFPSARLLIAGGASLLDHHAYQARFAGVLTHCGASAEAVIRTGPLPQRLMPALYRAAALLVFPSTQEGFGLAVLEAMASGVPVATSRMPPFTEYLSEEDVLWCNPFDANSIGDAMARSLEPSIRDTLGARGLRLAARHDWETTARAHLSTYEKLREPIHA